jgi:3-dehydroquinate synthase
MLDDASRKRILALIEKAGLPARGLRLDVDQTVAAMLFDKKVRGGKVRFILPDRIGQVIIRDNVPPNIVRAAVESLR